MSSSNSLHSGTENMRKEKEQKQSEPTEDGDKLSYESCWPEESALLIAKTNLFQISQGATSFSQRGGDQSCAVSPTGKLRVNTSLATWPTAGFVAVPRPSLQTESGHVTHYAQGHPALRSQVHSPSSPASASSQSGGIRTLYDRKQNRLKNFGGPFSNVLSRRCK